MGAIKRKRRKRKSRYKTGIHNSIKCISPCKYRSGWELAYMQYLDNDADVISYTYEKIKIPYLSNKSSGKFRTYYPDFCVCYVNNVVKIIEIKPSRKLQQHIIIKKHLAANNWCSQRGVIFEVITEIELKLLGLL